MLETARPIARSASWTEFLTAIKSASSPGPGLIVLMGIIRDGHRFRNAPAHRPDEPAHPLRTFQNGLILSRRLRHNRIATPGDDWSSLERLKKAESGEEFEGEEIDEPVVEEADVDLDQADQGPGPRAKRAQKKRRATLAAPRGGCGRTSRLLSLHQRLSSTITTSVHDSRKGAWETSTELVPVQPVLTSAGAKPQGGRKS